MRPREVERLARPDRSGAGLGLTHHARHVPEELAPVERRLEPSAVLQVDRALAGQQAVAEQHPGAPERGSLLDPRGVGQEHVPYVVRVAEEDQAAAGDAKPCEVAPLSVDAGEEPERVAPQLEEVATGEPDHRHQRNGMSARRRTG